jgi:tRNA A-37 threonylcarbamoyl transferase component Bud32
MGHTPPTIVAGKYEILGRLGEGGQGSVWKVRHVELDQIRAMKWQPDEGLDDSALRFRREGLALARLRHPHIVEVFDFGRDAEAHYLVMEYVEGQNLAQRLRSRGRPTVPDALEIGRQVAGALAYAHRQPYVDSQGRRHEGMIHRDIKPSNILLRDQVQVHVLLADFGLVKLGDAGERTTTGAVMGTYKYSAPEQLGLRRGRERVVVDLRADVFAFGLVLYELLEGRQFHEGLDMGEVLGRVLYEELEPEFEQPVSTKLRALVTSCMRRYPEQRPDTMDVVLRELDLSLAELRGDETQTRFVPPADQDIDEQIEVLLRERDRRRVQTAQAAARAARQQAVAAEAEELVADAFAEAVRVDDDASIAVRAGKLDQGRQGYERAAELFAEAGAAAVVVRQRREIDALVPEVAERRVRAEAEGAPELTPEAFERAAKLAAAAHEALGRGELDGVARDLRAAQTEFAHAARDAVAVRTRREAKAARQRLATVRGEAEAADAPQLVARSFTLACDVETQAEAALGSGDVLAARDLYERAIEGFERARTEAGRERDRRAASAAQQEAERVRTASRDVGAAELAPDEQRRAEAVIAEAEAALAREEFADAAAAFGRAATAFAAAADAARASALERARASAAHVRERADAARGEARDAGVGEAQLREAEAALAAGESHAARGDFAAAETAYARAQQLYADAIVRERRARAEAARQHAERAREGATREHAARAATATWNAAQAQLEVARRAVALEQVVEAEQAFAGAATLYERATAEVVALREETADARRHAEAARAAAADEGRRWASEALARAEAVWRDAEARLAAHEIERARACFVEAAQAFDGVVTAAATRRAEAEARAKQEAERARAAVEVMRARADEVDAAREAALLVQEATLCFEEAARAFEAGDYGAARNGFTEAAAAYERAATDAHAAIEARARRAAEERTQAKRTAEQASHAAETARRRAAATSAERDAAPEAAAADTQLAAGRAAFDAGDYATAARTFAAATTAYEHAATVAQATADARVRAEAEARARAEAEALARARQVAAQAREQALTAQRAAAATSADRDAVAEMRQATAAFDAATAAFESDDYARAGRSFADAAQRYEQATTAARTAAAARARADAEARARAEAEERARVERVAEEARARATAAQRAAAATSAEHDAVTEMQQAAARFSAATTAFDAGDHVAAARAFGDAATAFEAAIAAARDVEGERTRIADAEALARAAAEARARQAAAERARARQAAERAGERAIAAQRQAAATSAEQDAATTLAEAATRFAAATTAFEQGDHATAERDFDEATRRYGDAVDAARAAAAVREGAAAAARAREAEERARQQKAAEQARQRAEAARKQVAGTTADRDAAEAMRSAADALAAATAAFAAGDHMTAARGFVQATDAFEQAADITRAAVEARGREEAERRARAESEAKARAAQEKVRQEEEKARQAEEKRQRARAKQAAEQARVRAETERRRTAATSAERDAPQATAEARDRFDAGTAAFKAGDHASAEQAFADATKAFERAADEARAAADARAVAEAREREAAAAERREAAARATVEQTTVVGDVTQAPRTPAAGRTPSVRDDDRTQIEERTQLDVPVPPPVVVPSARPTISPAVVGGAAVALALVGVVAWIATRPGSPPPSTLEWARATPAEARLAAREGKPLAFAVALHGDEKAKDIQYTWTLDGTRQATGPTWTFTPDLAGGKREHDVRVVASRAGQELERAWHVDVANVDRPPQIVSPPGERTTIEVEAGAPVALQVRASDPDLADGDALSYAWERDGKRIASAAEPSISLPDARDGEHVRVAVVDKEGLEARREWTIVVKSKAEIPKPPEPAQVPPTIVELTPPEGKLELAEGASRAFRVRATDPNPGDVVRYAWLVDGRKVASDASFVLQAPADAKERQRMTVELQVADATGTQLTREWTVNVTASRPRVTSPDPKAPEVTLKPGESRVFAVQGASERTGARIRFEWTLDDRPMAGAGDALTLPTDLSAGRHTVQVVALDERDLRSDPRRWSIVVKSESPPTTLQSGRDVTDADVQRWLGQYRAAFENNDRAALIALGVAANAAEAERMTSGWGKREVTIKGQTIERQGTSAKVIFHRTDHDKEADRDVPYPSALTYELRKEGDHVRAVR